VHSISNFIYVETETATGSRTSSTEDGKSEVCKDDAFDDGGDLEGQLMALGERWTVLCTWVEERGMRLSCIRDELELLEREKERLTTWLDRREGVLREMDRTPSDCREDLLRQGQLIAVSQQPFFMDDQWGLYFLNTILYCIDLLGGYLELVVPARRGLGKIE